RAAPQTHAPQARRAGRIGNWPSVRFTIPHVSWLAGDRRGEVYRDDSALIIEFQDGWWLGRAPVKQLRIPFSDITSLCCQTESGLGLAKMIDWPKGKKVPRWLRNRQTTEVVRKAGGSK